MNLVDRFRYVMKVYNETPSSFADKIGVQRSSISHILSERNKPSLDFIQKILEHYPKIDAQWLINGKQSTNEKMVTSAVNSSIEPEREDAYLQEEERQALQKEQLVELNSDKIAVKANKQLVDATKKVDRIIIFYSDHTFETFNPPN
jgi:transcriptional regulator with XRE-family HTH domain